MEKKKVETSYDRANQLGREADAMKDRNAALDKYAQAWDSVPEPKYQWDGGTWIWTSIFRIHFSQGNIDEALNALFEAEKSHRGRENSRVQFLLGMMHLDYKNDPERARPYFQCAWDLSEGRAFKNEDQKYVRFLKNLA